MKECRQEEAEMALFESARLSTEHESAICLPKPEFPTPNSGFDRLAGTGRCSVSLPAHTAAATTHRTRTRAVG
jgi:hypothetical protein